MAMNATIAPDAEILARAVGPAFASMPAESAHCLSGTEFSAPDLKRMAELSAAARAGTLNAGERTEAEAYGRVGMLLGILRIQARARLKPERR